MSFSPQILPAAGIQYLPFKSLGGRRRPAKDSPNTGWRNDNFRGYADFMQTPAFERGLGELMEQARRMPTATMCAEAVPWRCHRSLISDALLVRRWRVLDIIGGRKAAPHQLTSFARVEGMKIVYPAVGNEEGGRDLSRRSVRSGAGKNPLRNGNCLSVKWRYSCDERSLP